MMWLQRIAALLGLLVITVPIVLWSPTHISKCGPQERDLLLEERERPKPPETRFHEVPQDRLLQMNGPVMASPMFTLPPRERARVRRMRRRLGRCIRI